MSVFYDLASLVLVPSGYKANKVYAQKPQTTDGQLAFTRASTATRVNASGLVEAVATGVPRLDYLNSTCPKLLLEPQRTNVATYSEQFDNAAYSKISGGAATAPIVTANFATSPDGFQNADRLQFARTGTTASDFSAINQSSLTLSATGTATIYLKSNTSSNQNVLMYWGGGQGQVFSVTPEWQRFTLTNLSAGTDAIVIGTRGGSGSFFNGGSLTLDVLFYGFQLEVGAYATSYIPTTTAAVTRVADAASKTSATALIGQTEGTLYWEGIAPPADTVIMQLEKTSPLCIARFIKSASNITAQVYIDAIAFNFAANIAPAVGTALKLALAYKSGSLAFYANGAQIGVSSSAFTGLSLDTLRLANDFGTPAAALNENKQVLLFTTRLTNAQLAELTAL